MILELEEIAIDEISKSVLTQNQFGQEQQEQRKHYRRQEHHRHYHRHYHRQQELLPLLLQPFYDHDLYDDLTFRTPLNYLRLPASGGGAREPFSSTSITSSTFLRLCLYTLRKYLIQTYLLILNSDFNMKSFTVL